MSKHIRGKVNNQPLNTIAFFSQMTDEDFIAVHNAGQLKNLCQALALDLQPKTNEKDHSYSA